MSLLTGHSMASREGYGRNIALSFLSNYMSTSEFSSWDSISTANLLCITTIAVFTVAVLPFYPGDYRIFRIFGVTVLALAAVPLLGRPSFFTLFLVLFLCLGFWLKVVTHFLFRTAFIEPVRHPKVRDGSSPISWYYPNDNDRLHRELYPRWCTVPLRPYPRPF